MMKIAKYLPEALFALAVAAAAFAVAGRPGLDTSPRPAVSISVRLPFAPLPAKVGGIIRPVQDVAALKERNIFAAGGAYGEEAGKLPPENPYTLIGVLRGLKMTAMFRDYAGAVTSQSVGKTMGDGFRISRIEDDSVVLERQGEKKTLHLFSARGSTLIASYTLLGILEGKQRKAVFRNDKGAAVILTVGAALPDGAVVKAIDPLGVKLVKDGKQTVIRIFGGQAKR